MTDFVEKYINSNVSIYYALTELLFIVLFSGWVAPIPDGYRPFRAGTKHIALKGRKNLAKGDALCA